MILRNVVGDRVDGWLFLSPKLPIPEKNAVCFKNHNFKILFILGHYISDVYDIKKQAWFTYNDLEVSKIQEASVQSDRDRSGYIFFYMHK